MNYPSGALLFFLTPLSWIYGWVTAMRRKFYARGMLSSFRLQGKVISVGNVTAGGTGKTPVTLALCEALKSKGFRPAILSRGYKSGLAENESAVFQGDKLVQPAQNSVAIFGDEARMQAAALGDVPVIIGRNRWEAAQRFLQDFPPPTHWILDDGFQHLKIQRDIDIVLLDASEPLGNGRILPTGYLRESPKALQFADWIIYTRADADHPSASSLQLAQSFGKPWTRITFSMGAPSPRSPLKIAPETITSWILLLGIAHPERLVEAIKKTQLPIARIITVQDHEPFNFTELKSLAAPSTALLTTAKDYWRDRASFDNLNQPVFIVPLHLEWMEPHDFTKIIDLFT